MSDDESTYSSNRPSVMNRYLYGVPSNGSDRDEDADENSIKRRSKSQDSSRLLDSSFESTNRPLKPGQTRIRTKEIERHVTWKNVHSLVNSQSNRLINEKEELNQLNSRLDQLVESIKIKKSQNDDLQEKINQYKEELMSGDHGGSSKLKRTYDEELNNAKRVLNNESQQSSISKIRASRSMYDLDKLREQFDNEMRYQTTAREKIRILENQRAESLHELSYLKENCESKKKSLLDDADKNEKLRAQLRQLSDGLDSEQEKRVDLECKIQTILEKKKFDEELFRIMREELERLFVYSGDNRISDPNLFFNNELREIKERIREDFIKLNEFNLDTYREEYEHRYIQTIEEIETTRRAQEEAAKAAEAESQATMLSLNEEFNRNQEEIKNLKLNEFRLNQLLDELNSRLGASRVHIENEKNVRDIEIAELREKINNLKNDLSSMLGFSKTLDAEVSVYARLLNERFSQSISQTINTTVTSESTFSYERYKNSIFKPTIIHETDETEREMRRRLELEELRKKQYELEENHRRLKELELEREREREKERERRQRELEEQQRRQRELEEQKRQREIEDQQRRQREFEEQERRRQKEREEQLRKQKEFEEQQRRQRELEEQQRRQREIEEQQKRQREIEELERRRREQEELLRIQREQEEQRRKEKEEQERKRLKEIKEYEELQRKKFEAEEQLRLKREYEIQLEYEEKERQKQRRLKEIEEQERQRRLQQEELERQRRQKEQEELIIKQQTIIIEQQRRQQREYEFQQQQVFEQQRRQKEIEEQQKRQKESEDQLRRQRECEEQMRRQRECEEQQRRIREMEIKKEQERQQRLQIEREEHEKYIIEKLRQEQELIEIQQRKKFMQEQREREKQQIELRDRQLKQQQQQQQQVKCVDNISSYTKRVIEEKHKSTEFYEEHRIEHVPVSHRPCEEINRTIIKHNVEPNYEKQINIKLVPYDQSKYCEQSATKEEILKQQTSQNYSEIIESKKKQDNYSANVVDHCVSTNNGHKHVLIVNSYKPKQTVAVKHQNSSYSNISANTGGPTTVSRSQSPPIMRNIVKTGDGSSTEVATKASSQENASSKYAIKHKANRYVSGAIGILETSLNGEYIILENLSSNKNVNLKGWYIHRYVPDQNINVIFKFTSDTYLASGEKLKILSRSHSSRNQIRSTSMHEGLNKTNSTNFKEKGCKGEEKLLVANNVENWGTYSKFSVTKLINPEGVDKAVLTQSLLRLASSTSNVNIVSTPNEANSSANIHRQLNKNSISTSNLNSHMSSSNIAHHQSHHANRGSVGSYIEVKKPPLCSNVVYSHSHNNQFTSSSPRINALNTQPTNFYPAATETIQTTTTTKKTSTVSSSSHHHQTTHSGIPVSQINRKSTDCIEPSSQSAINVHVTTRQF